MAGFAIFDSRNRDAKVEVASPTRPARHFFVNEAGVKVKAHRLIKCTEGHDHPALARQFGDAEELAAALVAGDPEIDLELVGRRAGTVDRVWLRPDGRILHSARVLKAVYAPTGDELSREDFIDVEATVDEESALPWSGRLLPIDRVVRSFSLVRKLQLRHINGLTFDFLRDIAKTLADSGKMLFVGSGAKGTGPLVFQRNGSPYRGFLAGRVDGDGFLLVLHLSNLELKRPQEAE